MVGFLIAAAFALSMPSVDKIQKATIFYVVLIVGEYFVFQGIYAKKSSGFLKEGNPNIENLKRMSIIYMIIGNILALIALAGVFVSKIAFLQWHTFFVGLFIAVAGSGFLGMPAKMEHKEEDETTTRVNPVKTMQNVLEIIKAIDFTEINTERIKDQIEDIQLNNLVPFAEARHAFQHDYGIVNFADFFSDFATGERNINRAWSALVDGYMDETRISLVKAFSAFETCHNKLVKLDQNNA